MPLLRDNRALLDRFRSGEQRALEEVYRAYVGPLFTLFRNGFSFQSAGTWCRAAGQFAEHEIEELVQETFRRAFEERARLTYDGLRLYKSYLFTIARNHVIDQMRRTKPELVEDLQNTVVDDFEGEKLLRSAEQQLQDQQLQKLLREFVLGLDATSRQVFEQRFVKERDQRDVQKDTGITMYKMRRLELSLRRQLLAFFSRHGYLPE